MLIAAPGLAAITGPSSYSSGYSCSAEKRGGEGAGREVVEEGRGPPIESRRSIAAPRLTRAEADPALDTAHRSAEPRTMGRAYLMCVVTLLATTTAYIPHEKEHFLTDALLREMVDRMGSELEDAADAYMDFPDSSRMGLVPGRAIKDLEAKERQEFPLDYDHLLEAGNPSTSIRDQEYLQHSSLWGHQYMTGGAGEGKQRLKPDGAVRNQVQVKTDAALPAYCNPPNPCPIGYSADDGCLQDFENTAAYSREYQAAQDCMCDSEHMFDCPVTSGRDLTGSAPGGGDLTESDIDRIMQQFQVEDQHKSLVAKKFHVKKDGNPFLRGDRLPVAAKKGINVNY
ncbi:neuroendocrine protein 7B2 [Bacillus rossius redtenbacheri]|uniref:neuroendocrine protein 7B2 n=1 Tax=Bacillus rossius redtenbacheri TaxID=93214 RepID=UPI002FDCC2C9